MTQPNAPSNSLPTTAALRAVTTTAARILTEPPRRYAAISYLKQRGIRTDALPSSWSLGYAPPGWTRLTDTLLADGFSEQALLDAGLSRRSSRGNLIDVFRDRVIFPVHDHDGQVAGFIGRDLSGAPAAPKYLNTRETPLFSKGTLLYGLHEARATNSDACRPVLVEGPLDVLAIVTRSDLTADARLLPIASCGTAVTTAQAKMIASIAGTKNMSLVVAMDADSAGRSAAVCAGEQLRRAGLDAFIAVLPNGSDPADYLANPGSTLRRFHTDSALPLLTVQVQNCIAVQSDRMQWVEGRLAAARTIAAYLATYPVSYAAKQIGWIGNVLDLDTATFTFEAAAAYRGPSIPRTPMTPPSVAPATVQASLAGGSNGRGVSNQEHDSIGGRTR